MNLMYLFLSVYTFGRQTTWKGFGMKKKAIKNNLAGGILLMLFSVFLLFHDISYVRKEMPKNQTIIEKTGYFKSMEFSSGELTITLITGEKYIIWGYMYHSSDLFDKDEFWAEVNYGDKLHFIIWEEDKERRPHIYYLECNDKIYLSYDKAMTAVQRSNMESLNNSIAIFIFCSGFLIFSLIRYAKFDRNKEL